LYLDNNQLSGLIPQSICNLPEECTIALGWNQLCPPYPDCLKAGDIGTQNTLECGDDCSYIGDLNNDGGFNVLDVIALVNLVLNDEDQCEGDMNGDGGLNVLDVVELVGCVLSDDCGG